MDNSLAGLTVVVTRPAHQAQPLSTLISQSGGLVVEFPVIEIRPSSNPNEFKSQLARLNTAQLVIFISANAVNACIEALGGSRHWPDTVPIAAVGRATATRLEFYGLTANMVAPKPYNSESLLTMPELQKFTSEKVFIFRGEGGREVLADTLRKRGAEVVYVECYRRIIPDSDPASLYQCWDEGRILLFVVTSNESLLNLVKMVNSDYKNFLLESQILVVSDRAVALASSLGFILPPVIATDASKEAIMAAIKSWRLANN